MNINYEDFIPIYPKVNDPDLQYKIGVKKEFLNVSGKTKESTPRLGELFRHQKAFLRYMIQYDYMLNIQGLGTGKSCAMVAIAEYFRKHNDQQIRKVYILEKGETTRQEFKQQLACKCTNRQYITDRVNDITKTEDLRNRALNSEIKKGNYEILTYGQLVNKVQEAGTDPKSIDDAFSGSIFFVDEAHNLISKKKSKGLDETYDEDMIQKNKEIDKDKQYNILWNLFHHVKRSKVILATATPMMNEVGEIAKLMNLILPMNMQMPETWNYTITSISQLEPFFRGRVSFVGTLDTGLMPNYEGIVVPVQYEVEVPDENQNIPFICEEKDDNGNVLVKYPMPKVKTSKFFYESSDVIYPLKMKGTQLKSYMSEFKSPTFDKDSRNISCLVFPDGSSGGDFKSRENLAVTKYIEKVRENTFKLSKLFEQKLASLGLEGLDDLSVKFQFIIEQELNAALRRQDGEIVGNGFCFSENVTGSGAIALGLIMEKFGFEKFSEPLSVFVSGKGGFKDYCSSADTNKVIKQGFEKKLRYGYLDRDSSEVERAALIELVNSPENYNGEYCQFIIGTPSSRDGINISNVLRGYLLMSGWNESGTQQALARFVRSTSHEYISQELKDRGIVDKVDIKIYKLAAITSDEDINKSYIFKNQRTNPSIDIGLYNLSENKNINIRRMMRMMKQCAFDCTIHHSRNTERRDLDYSAACDYNVCNYTCYPSNITENIEKEDEDTTTFDILYADEIIDECKELIIDIIQEKNMVKIADIYKNPKFDIYTKKYIIMSIDSLLKDRTVVRNRFGFRSFINTDGVILFTQTELPSYNKLLDNMNMISNYRDNLFVMKKCCLDKIVNEIEDNDDKIWKQIQQIKEPDTDNYELFTDKFEKLSPKFRVNLLETITLDDKYVSDKLYNAIINKLKWFLYKINEPLTDIFNIKKYLSTSDQRRGRNRKQVSCPKVNIDFVGEEDRGEEVFVHSYYDIKENITSFRTNTQFLTPGDNIRIYKPSEKVGWRSVYDYECSAYKNVIEKHIDARLKEYEKFKYIGTLLSDKKFRIIETKNLNIDEKDKRSRNKGNTCFTYKDKFSLIEILFDADFFIPELQDYEDVSFDTQDEYINYLLNDKSVNKTKTELKKYSIDDLDYFVRWLNFSKEDICNYIQEIFEKEDRLIKV